MGWSFFIDPRRGKKDRVDDLVNRQKAADAEWRYVDHSVVGNNLWMVVKHSQTGLQEVSLVLLQAGDESHGWGYKYVNHREGVDIPLSLLLQLSPDDSSGELTWRDAVKRHHKEKSDLRKYAKSITVGRKFALKGGRMVVKQAYPGNADFYVGIEIQNPTGEWMQTGCYKASRKELSKLPPFVATLKNSKGEDLSETQQSLFA